MLVGSYINFITISKIMKLLPKENRLRQAFNKIKSELNDHLHSINENTNEIQSNFEYISKLEMKIDKLNEKIEELMILQNIRAEEKKPQMEDVRLTIREQEVFLILYTQEQFLTYSQIAKKLGLTESLVISYVTNLIAKGVPILKKFENKRAKVKLEAQFRKLQAKQNILKISPRVANDYLK
ncbi:MAG: hypothetical protein MAG795_00464 [Candidatus Woesearchaeota archaeon]|nr:hypothetical protein [Candidatus Woesearchaeota archaeon]